MGLYVACSIRLGETDQGGPRVLRTRAKSTIKQHPILRQEVVDRLQRYEGSLERSFDRTLSQLERLQRLRLGQPVLPALKKD